MQYGAYYIPRAKINRKHLNGIIKSNIIVAVE